jgi:hypothetical protein
MSERKTIWEQMANNKTFVGKTLVEIVSGNETKITDVTYENDFFEIIGENWNFGFNNGPNGLKCGVVHQEGYDIAFYAQYVGCYGVKT